MNVNNEHCCEIKQYCDYDPSKCPIAKRNKDIDEFEKSRSELLQAIKSCLSSRCKKCPKCGADLVITRQKIISLYKFYFLKKFKLSIPYKFKMSKEKVCYNCGYYEPKIDDKQIDAVYEQIISQRIKNCNKGGEM